MACEPSCNQVNISADFTIIPSQRGGDLLIFNGYRYSKRRLNKNGHVVWRCVRRKTCKASLITHQQALIKNEKHSCTSNEVIMKLKLEYRCIERAVKETTPIPSIYSEVVEEFNNAGYDLFEQMPSFDIMKKVLYRRRHQALQTNKTRFLRVQDVKVPGNFEKLVLADYCEDGCRILVFASPKVKKVLSNSNHVFLDGTFKCISPPFTQLYTVHVDLNSTNDSNSILSYVYALLPNKKQKTYNILFLLVKSQVPSFKPNVNTLDYEASAMAAIPEVFPGSKIQGCSFHFSHCLWIKALK